MPRQRKAPSKVGRPLSVSEAEPGWYKTRLVSGGPWIACRVFMIEGAIAAERDGQGVEMIGDVPEGWPWHPITKAEFDYMTNVKSWAEKHDPSDPIANPRQRIDIRKMRPPL